MISEAEIAAIIEARHDDPFALLGPHALPGGGTVLRAFIPGAETLSAEAAGGTIPLTRLHRAGFFEGLVPGPGHRWLLAGAGSVIWREADPYAFGPILGPLDDHLLLEGTHQRLPERLGAHPLTLEGIAGWRFALWAPHAQRVSVVGDFNRWDGSRHPMRRRVDSGLWEIFLPGLHPGAAYKFEIRSREGVILPLKADPYGFAAELRPGTASLLHAPDGHRWGDAAWLQSRASRQARGQPMSIYEVHATSWKRHWDGRFWNWDELAAELIPYVVDLGFTHIELMPVMEHPLDMSWGYQTIGLHAPTARLGEPAGLKRFIDAAHQAEIGVLLDWVPAHFPKDAHGLAMFDGEPLYEHPDPRRGAHPDWGTAIYDFGRPEVLAFLVANALFWLREYHADGLRVDAVSSMIRLDYSRAEGEWAPNAEGGRENLDAVAFLRRLNALVREAVPGALMIAEDATDRPGISRPPEEGGLGFHMKWNMGWMNDTLRYMALAPAVRPHHHRLMNFSILYAWNEDFLLPLSHDEVVHGKATLLGRMPETGMDDWQRFANLRAYYGFMWGHPGKKLLFMGQEFAPWREWTESRELDWWLLQYPRHQAMQGLVRALNHLHRGEAALHALDHAPQGFGWIDADDAAHCSFAWLRFGGPDAPPIAVLSNFTAAPREFHRIGLPHAGQWDEVLNTDDIGWGGSGMGNPGGVRAVAHTSDGFAASAMVTLPPLATIYLRYRPEGTDEHGER